MKPFPNRTGIFQRIRLSIARELISMIKFAKAFLITEASQLWSFAL
jgi:hypothetical protein